MRPEVLEAMGKRRQRQNSDLGSVSRSNQSEVVGRYAKRRAKTKHGRIVRRVLLTLLVLVLAAAGAAFAWVASLQAKMNDKSVVTDELRASLVEKEKTTDPFYMLLLGTDGRPGEEVYRSDTIILARIDPQNKKVALVSIPRDTKVTINGQTQKINAAHAIGGAQGAVQAVSTLCGVDISHYAEVSFDGMTGIVDAIGGVQIDVEDNINDWKAGNIKIQKGEQVLNGAAALTYARSRKFTDGDYTRMKHQRHLIEAIVKQVLNNTDATTIVPLLNSTADMVKTDMSITEIADLANQMRGMNVDTDLYSANVPSTTADVNGVSYVVANMPELQEMMDRIDRGEDPQGPTTMNEGLGNTVSEDDAASAMSETGNGNTGSATKR